ncbi:uncharacterized protein LOC128671894 [Plodia interpunctella]|uniref:uncharacterized protein LOC128671894 n=1 Tax=Plodia interpunctella TaxID=58824 RepID=UPI002367DA9E|nr:uncharacterized protein LOC128671894 [Plodia interpunctella]
MDGEDATFDINNQYSNGHDISENATILEEGLRVCPLCQSEIKLFFINLNEKLLMCENVECEYPFGHEDLQFFRADNSMDEASSIPSKPTINNTSASCSTVSAAAWSEIDHMNRVFESDESQLEYIPKRVSKFNKEREKNKRVLTNLQCIKGLNNELNEINCGSKRKIVNKKYISSLMSLQAMSGKEMLQPEELNILNNEKGIPEVKIDVNTDTENCMSSIKIELVDITNQEKSTEDKK